MAEQRRQAMQESKFLGGDMEHTHLVKGLDYALLQKVRLKSLSTLILSTKKYYFPNSDTVDLFFDPFVNILVRI